MSDRALVPAGIAFGILAYAVFASGLLLPRDIALVGDLVYNYYFLALAEGRFDIPPRIATLEGHYDAAGRAYVYHGIAPLLTRMLAAPFVDLRGATWLAGASIGLFAALGALAYHLTLLRLIRAHAAPGRGRVAWHAIAAGMAWLCAPGLLLAANQSMFHEPTAVAFACVAWSVYLHAAVIFHGARPAAVVIPLAVLAGLSVFARPNVAVALYLGVGLLMLTHLARERLARLAPLVAATLVLGAFGAGLLAFNAARFGDPLQMFGANEAAPVEYGFAYWGLESPQNAERLEAFVDHGTFNAGRVGPNLMLYAMDVPWEQITGVPERVDAGPLDALYRDLTLERLGYIRVEAPRIGFVYLWAPWLLLAVLGLLRPPRAAPAGGDPPARGGYRRGWIALATTGAMALLILSYGTVTLRYRVEVFPLIAVLGLLALPRVLAWQSARPDGGRAVTWAMGAATAGAGAVSLGVAVMYADNFPQMEVISRWSLETCERLVLEKGFDRSDVARLCAL